MHDKPLCCQQCEFLGDMLNEITNMTDWACDHNVFLPTKMGTCKRQVVISDVYV